jgi:hypothetical protein
MTPAATFELSVMFVAASANRACQGVAVCTRHGAKDLTLNALHGEERNKTGEGNQRREENCLVYLDRADQNHS